MKHHQVTIKVGSAKKSLEKFKVLWNKIEKGEIPEETIEEIHFANAELLFKTLTMKRLELLKHVHNSKHISIRALAKILDRDYKNVYQDVQALCQIGLILKDTQELLTVPYDKVKTEFSLDLAA